MRIHLLTLRCAPYTSRIHRGCASVGVDTDYVFWAVFTLGMLLLCLLLKESGIIETLTLALERMHHDAPGSLWSVQPYPNFGVLHFLAVANFLCEQSFLFSKLSVVRLF